MSKKTYQSHERICTGRLEGRLTITHKCGTAGGTCLVWSCAVNDIRHKYNKRPADVMEGMHFYIRIVEDSRPQKP